MKKIIRSSIVQNALTRLAALYIWLVHATSRVTVQGGDIPKKFWDAGQPFILAFWHGRLLMMPYAWRRGQPVHMLISAHRDGRLIAHTVQHFGITTIAGSTNKGGAGAVRSLLKALKNGACIGITPDGPRGPAMTASDGIIDVARLSGIPIVPLTYTARRGRFLKTWDRFLLAFPFTRLAYAWGEPMSVDRHADTGAATRTLEHRLRTMTCALDAQYARHTPVPPPCEAPV